MLIEQLRKIPYHGPFRTRAAETYYKLSAKILPKSLISEATVIAAINDKNQTAQEQLLKQLLHKHEKGSLSIPQATAGIRLLAHFKLDVLVLELFEYLEARQGLSRAPVIITIRAAERLGNVDLASRLVKLLPLLDTPEEVCLREHLYFLSRLIIESDTKNEMTNNALFVVNTLKDLLTQEQLDIVRHYQPKVTPFEDLVRGKQFDLLGQSAHKLIDELTNHAPDNLSVQALSVSVNLRRCMDNGDYTSAYEHFERMITMAKGHAGVQRSLGQHAQLFVRAIHSSDDYLAKNAPLLDFETAMDFQNKLPVSIEPWTSSPINRLQHANDESRRAVRAKAASSNKIQKVLVLSDNWNFTSLMLKDLERVGGYQVRTVEPSKATFGKPLPGLDEIYANVLSERRCEEVWEHVKREFPVLANLVKWADVVLIEWSSRNAAWCSNFLPPDKKVAVRLHSFEAFSFWPYFVNWGGVDALIFVAPHIRDFVKDQIGDRLAHTTINTIHNFNDLSTNQTRTRTEDERYSIGMMGYSNLNKHPILALEILAQLVAKDRRWSLHLVGHPWGADESLAPEERDYKAQFFAYIEANKLQANVTYHDFTPDVSQWFQKVGYVISCSNREGTHEAVIDGVSVGCIPVIRDWPMAQKYNGTSQAFSAFNQYIYQSIDEAITLLDTTVDQAETLRADISAAAKRDFDHEAVAPKLINAINSLNSTNAK